MAVIEAEYGSRCVACPLPIEPGDSIRYNEDFGAWVHEGDEVADLELAASSSTPVCPSCRMQLPLSGRCGGCE